MKTFISKSPEDTKKLGAKIAILLKKGDVLALVGELGSGKTTFTKGIAKGLGVAHSKYVNSPSFVIVNEYKGRLPLYHMDLYRLDRLSQIETIGYEEYLWSGGVCVIEWADKIKKLLPGEYIEIELRHRGAKERAIRLIPKGRRYKQLSESIK